MKTILALVFAIITAATAEPVTVALRSGGTIAGTLVSKSASEIKVETSYGVIALQPDMAVPESWAAVQRATPSKPSGKYTQPYSQSRGIAGNGNLPTAPPAFKTSPYDAGLSDGRIVGKHDAATGKDRDGEKAMRIGKLHSQSYPNAADQTAYAKGYHEGYNDGWQQRHAYEKLKD